MEWPLTGRQSQVVQTGGAATQDQVNKQNLTLSDPTFFLKRLEGK